MIGIYLAGVLILFCVAAFFWEELNENNGNINQGEIEAGIISLVFLILMWPVVVLIAGLAVAGLIVASPLGLSILLGVGLRKLYNRMKSE